MSSLSNALVLAFNWHKTSEREDFWCMVSYGEYGQARSLLQRRKTATIASPNLNSLSNQIYEANKAKGFWDKERNVGELLMLVTSELGEAMEAHR
ncbi:hypothetical protein RZS08_52105, partial [Arthrospira platensis SPKY1]|nr:hypothetical protein [Arthrospira platensis SPKY1]